MLKISHVSTYVFGNTNRQSTVRAQADLAKASHESVTGHLYDPGVELGYKTGHFVHNENRIAEFNTLQDTNNLALQRMEIAQLAMKNLVYSPRSSEKDVAEGTLVKFNKMLLGGEILATPKTMQATAQATLDSFVSALNTNKNGEYVFGGTNSRQAPLNYYKSGSNEGASAVVRQAFTSHFGFTPDDPAVAKITATEIEAFIDGPFTQLFEQPLWGTHFSKAANEVPQNRISANGEMVHIGVSANEDGFRHIMRNLVLVAEFGDMGLNKDAQNALSDSVRVDPSDMATGQAITHIINTSAKLGGFEAQLKNANERLAAQIPILNKTRNHLVAVDRYEASQRVTQLMTIMDASYQLTAKISRLSLVNYL